MKYRKKLVTVEAELVPSFPDDKRIESPAIHEFLDTCISLAEWCEGVSHMMVEDDEFAYEGCVTRGPHILVTTPNGEVAAREGDFIVEDVAGGFYPCTAEVFNETHELVV